MRVVFSLMFLIAGITCFAQIKSLPSVNVKSLEGNQFNFKNIDNNGNPIVISFWATWCKPCTKEKHAFQMIKMRFLRMQFGKKHLCLFIGASEQMQKF